MNKKFFKLSTILFSTLCLTSCTDPLDFTFKYVLEDLNTIDMTSDKISTMYSTLNSDSPGLTEIGRVYDENDKVVGQYINKINTADNLIKNTYTLTEYAINDEYMRQEKFCVSDDGYCYVSSHYDLYSETGDRYATSNLKYKTKFITGYSNTYFHIMEIYDNENELVVNYNLREFAESNLYLIDEINSKNRFLLNEEFIPINHIFTFVSANIATEVTILSNLKFDAPIININIDKNSY